MGPGTGRAPDAASETAFREFVTALGVSRGTVKSTVSRAVAKLRSDAGLAGRGRSPM